MRSFIQTIPLLPGFPGVTINMYEGHRLFVLEPCPMLTSKLVIQAVGTERETRQRDEEAEDCKDATGGVSETEASVMSGWGVAAIGNAQL